ncbi:hypothetical protein K3495_g16905, partial [Podosphaera aphanis]
HTAKEVSHKGLDLLLSQIHILEKYMMNPEGTDPHECHGLFTAINGLPCWHSMYQTLQRNSQWKITMSTIHPQWHLRPQAEREGDFHNTMKDPVTNDPPPLPAITQEAVARSVSSRHSHVNEPLLVKTKGRPKQAKAASRIPTALEFAQSQAESTMQATAKKVVTKKTKKIDQLSQLITSVL